MPCLLRLLVHVCTTKMEKPSPCHTFFRNHEPNRVPETSLSYLQNMSIYFPSVKYKLSIRSLLECYTIVLVCHFFFVPLNKRMFGAWEKSAHNFFSPELDNNLYQAGLSLVITQPFQYPFCTSRVHGTRFNWGGLR